MYIYCYILDIPRNDATFGFGHDSLNSVRVNFGKLQSKKIPQERLLIHKNPYDPIKVI